MGGARTHYGSYFKSGGYLVEAIICTWGDPGSGIPKTRFQSAALTDAAAVQKYKYW